MILTRGSVNFFGNVILIVLFVFFWGWGGRGVLYYQLLILVIWSSIIRYNFSSKFLYLILIIGKASGIGLGVQPSVDLSVKKKIICFLIMILFVLFL